MSTNSSIEWTETTWNPVTGCRKISEGCRNCYAETIANRFWKDRKFTDVRCHEDKLNQPLHWKKPRRIFVNSMSDLFHEDVPDIFIAAVLGIAHMAPQHTYQILTKRPERMLRVIRDYIHWKPLSNVWLGVSVEDQATADERIPLLLQTPAAVRWVSYEPALEGIDIRAYVARPVAFDPYNDNRLNWLVVGGESGPKARPFNIAWARTAIKQCKAAGVAVFMKQCGSNVRLCNTEDESLWPNDEIPWDYNSDEACYQGEDAQLKLKSRKGGDINEWPEDLQVREYPRA